MRHKPPTVFSYHEIKVENRCVANRRHSDIEELVYIHNYIKFKKCRPPHLNNNNNNLCFPSKDYIRLQNSKNRKARHKKTLFLQLQHTFDLYLNMNHILRETFKIAKSILRKKNKNINSWKYSIRVICLRLRQFVFSHISVHKYFAHIINRRKMYNTHLISNYRHFNIFCKIHFALF